MQIEAAERRVAGLEYSLRVYRDRPAAARIAEQLDSAWLDLCRLEGEARGGE